MRQRYLYAVLFVILLTLSLGYALLTTNLNIVGTTVVKDNKWDISMDIHGIENIIENEIEKFVKKYEEVTPLYMREIWNLGVCLRIALIEKIRGIRYTCQNEKTNNPIW
jgi:hypothetical protein